MKVNYMRKQFTEKQARMVIIERLNLQSVRRALWDKYSLKQNDLNYFESAEFAEKFSSWTEQKRNSFLREIGGIHQRVLENYIGRAAV